MRVSSWLLSSKCVFNFIAAAFLPAREDHSSASVVLQILLSWSDASGFISHVKRITENSVSLFCVYRQWVENNRPE